MRSALRLTGRALRAGRALFRDLRRTRPFWGGLWVILAGLWIIKMMHAPIALALNGGWDYSAGYVLGGLLILFGALAWLTPHYRTLVGLGAFLVSLAAFPAANLGGFLIGSLLGIFGASMIWSWGEKKPPSRQRRRGARRSSRRSEQAANRMTEVAPDHDEMSHENA